MVVLNVNIISAGYEKDQKTIQDICFSLERGELVGLIGQNGAGKSTTIKTILGLLQHVNGRIEFTNQSTYSYIPERPIFYDDLTLWEHLDFVAAVEGLPDESYRDKATELLDVYKLSEFAHQYPNTYSKGMQQKAMLILAMITNPDVYIIDEPFIGLDPNAMKLFLDSIQKERERGAGVLMCIHVLDTAEKICDRFLIIDQGQLKEAGTLANIRTELHLPEASLFDCFHFISGSQDHER